MTESFFDLSKTDQRETLEYARAQSGRPAHLLEKDIWVVWALRALFDSPLTDDLTFKGWHVAFQGLQNHRPFLGRY